MENLVVIAVWIAVILTALGLLMVAIFGIRSAINGKMRPVAVVSMVIPAVLIVLLYFVFSGQDLALAKAAVVTTVVMIVLGIGAVLLSGARGIFN